jgi:hypothetical protein
MVSVGQAVGETDLHEGWSSGSGNGAGRL